MKSSRIILLFAAVSIVIHGLVFLVKISPSERSPVPDSGHLIPVELAFVPKQALPVQAAPPVTQAEEPPAEPPSASEKPVPKEPVRETPQPEPVKQESQEMDRDTAPHPEQETQESSSQQQDSSDVSQNSDSTETRDSATVSVAAPVTQANPVDGLMQRVEINKRGSYPLRARKRGQQGTVIVSLILDKDGNMLNVEIIRKSRHSALNTAALELVEKIMETPYPHGLDKTVNFEFPITFRLD